MARRTGPAQPRPAAATALRLAVLAALCGCARAALTIDGYLAPLNVSAPGTWSSSSLYAPLFPSLVQSSSKPYPFQPGVVNTSAWNVTSVGGALQGSAFPTSNGLYAPSQGLGYSNASVVLDWNLLVGEPGGRERAQRSRSFARQVASARAVAPVPPSCSHTDPPLFSSLQPPTSSPAPPSSQRWD